MSNAINQRLEDLWNENLENFPFKGYINPDRKSAYFAMPQMLSPYIKPGSRILDFGCGPLDKTYMFKALTDELYAFDTLEDVWHLVDDNDQKIKAYAEQSGIKLLDEFAQISEQQYDVVMLHDVVEHFHASPRPLLNQMIAKMNPGGLLVLTVPNAGNIRKRLHLLAGKTNYPNYDYFYWYPGKWDGHVREYVRGDLVSLVDNLGLDMVKLQTFHIHLDILSPPTRALWKLISKAIPNTRDSFYLIARKPSNWTPRERPTKQQFEAAFGRQYFSKLIDQEQLDWD